MIKIETQIEGKRGCGYRKPGGLYLIGPPTGQNCCKLPFALTVCPCCGAGIRPARAWTWVDADRLFFPNGPGLHSDAPQCKCPLNDFGQIGKAGLIWIGEKFYPTPEIFLQEAREMGISRRIGAVPKDFKLGETWVLLAHRKVLTEIVTISHPDIREPIEGKKDISAIFSIFRPTAVEYVVKGDETGEDLERIVKRGLTPVTIKNRVPYE